MVCECGCMDACVCVRAITLLTSGQGHHTLTTSVQLGVMIPDMILDILLPEEGLTAQLERKQAKRKGKGARSREKKHIMKDVHGRSEPTMQKPLPHSYDR